MAEVFDRVPDSPEPCFRMSRSDSESLGARAIRLGDAFRKNLSESLSRFEMVKEDRGLGMMTGIEFAPPRKLSLRVLYEAFYRVHPAMFGQVLVMHLFREKGDLQPDLRQQFHGAQGIPGPDSAGILP